MPSAPITGIPIRLQVSTASSPPVPPIDVNTGQPPAQWRANAVAYQVGVFDVNGVSVDLSNLSYLQLTIAATQNAPANLIVQTVLAGAITPTITQSDWLAGDAQNASFDLSAAMTDVTLNAQPSQAYWLQLSGVTTGGSLIVYGAGTVNFYNSGSATPAPVAATVDYNAQTNSTGNGTIAPTTNIHTEKITIMGAARTSAFVVTAPFVVGYGAGALVLVTVALPVTVGITVNFLSQSLSGATLGTATTDGYVSKAWAIFGYDGTNYFPIQFGYS